MIQRCFAYLFQSGGRVQRNVFTRSSKWLIARRIQARANCKRSLLYSNGGAYTKVVIGKEKGEFERMGWGVLSQTEELKRLLHYIDSYFLQTAIPHEGIP